MASPKTPSFAQRLEEAKHRLGRGDAAMAVRLLVALNAERSDHPKVLHTLGVALAQTGRLAEAEAPLLRAIQLSPRDNDPRFDLAVLRDNQGRADDAERLLREIVAIQPGHARAWATIGMLRQDANDYAAAAEAYANAYHAHPAKPEYALAAAELFPAEKGATFLAECVERAPHEDRFLLPLAELLIRVGHFEDAERILVILKGRQLDAAIVSRHLGAIYFRLQRYPEAAAALYDAIRLDPNDPDIWVMLSAVRDAVGDPDGAGAAIGRAVDLRPEDLDLICRQALLQQNAALGEDARAAFQKLPERIRQTADVRLIDGMLMPPILDSNDHIDAVRARWMETMADVEARPTPIVEPWATVGLSGYNLGYHGREDRPLMEAFFRALSATSPHLLYSSPDLSGSGTKKLRVGFLSAYMRNHSVGRVLIRLMGALDRERFEVVLLQVPDKQNGGQEIAERNADRTVRVPTELRAAHSAIASERLDVLIFCDLHLHPFVDALSFARLAPVQATTWGHPGTGGRSSVDYWLSCEDWEPAGNERLYTEKLVRLPLPPFVFDRPVPPPNMRDRASYGLPEGVRLYGSLQSLIKFHPDIDEIFATLLERDPEGQIVLVEGPQYTYRRALQRRFARSFDVSRIHFIPRMGNHDYLSAVAACNVMLDPIHFGGANTSLEAFALGKPVVTMPGDQMRSRATGGFYRQMGYEMLVASSRAEYVDLAIRLGGDPAFYREASENILHSNGILYDNLEPVRGFEEWLLSVRR